MSREVNDTGVPPSVQPEVFEGLSNALNAVYEAISVEPRSDFRRQVADTLLSTTKALIDTLARKSLEVANDRRRTDQSQWAHVHKLFEHLQRRMDLLYPESPLHFEKTLRWMVQLGDRDDLRRLLQIQPDPPYASPLIGELFEVAITRIRGRIGTTAQRDDVQSELNAAAEAAETHKAEWEHKYRDQYIAFHSGAVVANDADRSALVARLLAMQRESGRFRACIIHVGAARRSARGPRAHAGTGRPRGRLR